MNRLLGQAETGLAQVLRCLASAEPGALAMGERNLMELVEAMCRIEQAVRSEPSLPIRESLLRIQKLVDHTRKLSSAALRTLAIQIESRHLWVATPSPQFCVEG